jgi:3-oxoacyl-[acyl-carrier-protein] synthase III
MKLTAIKHYVPRRVVSKDETMDLFRHYSRPYYADEQALEEVVRIVDKLLSHSQFRQCTVRGQNEPFYKNFIEMAREMIAQSGVDPKEIDTVIYCGISRGYMEPSTGCQMAAHLGLKKAEFFDILDACNGWSRAARVSESLLRTGASRNVLVLSLEFGRSPLLNASADPGFGSYHCAYSVRNSSELEWRIWSATLGEAGTATLWSRDDDSKWSFDYDCECEEFGDCSAALRNHREYDLYPMVLDDVHGGEQFFYAFGKRIGESIKRHLPPLLLKVQPWLDQASVVIPHSLSSAVYEAVFRQVGVHEKAVYPFNRYGNIASCGVPAGIVMALSAGRMKRGDRVVLAPTGSGSSAGVISFVY